MPGFNDNLKRAREAAGLSSEDLAGRIGAAPLWLAHLEAIGAALPELSHLVRLADALGCSLDDLLAGRDDEFDHPRRRHAALIAARLGTVSLLLATVNRARARRALSTDDERQVNETVLLTCVHRCRDWVTAPGADISIASDLERDLDAHIARISSVCDRVDGATPHVDGAPPPERVAPLTPAPVAAAPVIPPPVASRVSAGAVVPLLEALSSNDAAAATRVGPAAGPALAPPAPKPALPPGHRTSMWSRPSSDGGDCACEMYTATEGITVRLVCGERVLATKPCRNLDEAFSQSSAWKRLPHPESLTAEPLPSLEPAAVQALPKFTSGAA